MPRRAFKWDLVDSLPCHAFHACKRFQELNHGLLEKKKNRWSHFFDADFSLSRANLQFSISCQHSGVLHIFFCYVTFCACKARVIFLPAEQTLPSSKKKSSLIFWDIFYYFWPFPWCLKITEKVSFNIASYVYNLSRQKLIKNAKNAQFGEFLKT